MTTLIILSLITALLLWYALQGRDWLKSKPWAQPFFAWVEPIEIVLFKKSQTILFARLKIVSGLILMGLTQAGKIDLTPFMPLVPEQYQFYVNTAVNSLPAVLSLMGWFDELLRNKTTKPLELVAVPDKVVAESPALQDVIAKADDAKIEAVAVTAEAVAEAKAA